MGLLDFKSSAPPGLSGLLAQNFDPAEMRRQQYTQAMLQAGMALLQHDPHAPKQSFMQDLGRGLAGGAYGAQQGRQDFYKEGLMKTQLQDYQREQDDREREQTERTQRAAQLQQMLPELEKVIPGVSSWAQLYPDKAIDAYIKAKSGGQKRNLQPVGKGSMLYDEDTDQWLTPPAPNGGGGMPADIDDLNKMVKGYEGAPGVSRYREIQPMLSSMEKSLSDPKAVADLDFVYGVAKIMDPDSVVRESEGQTVIESQSLPAALLGKLNKIANGEQALLPEVRADLYRLAHRRASELRLQAEGESRYYTQTGKEYGIRPDQFRRLDPMPNDPSDPLGLRAAVRGGR